jgi:hypothetical protein
MDKLYLNTCQQFGGMAEEKRAEQAPLPAPGFDISLHRRTWFVCVQLSAEPTLRELVLSVRPGITGLTQIRYRHEEALLAQQPDPEKYYREVLLPLKLASDVEYVQRRSLAFDLYLLARTLIALFERE